MTTGAASLSIDMAYSFDGHWRVSGRKPDVATRKSHPSGLRPDARPKSVALSCFRDGIGWTQSRSDRRRLIPARIAGIELHEWIGGLGQVRQLHVAARHLQGGEGKLRAR